MTALTILTDALQSLPPKLRKALYILFALAVVTAGVLQVVGVDTGKLNDVLLYVGGFLGVTAASNVQSIPVGGHGYNDGEDF